MKHISVLLCLCLLLAGCADSSGESGGEVSPVSENPAQVAGESEPAPVQSLTPDSLEALLALTNERRRQITKPEPDTGLVENWDMGELEPPFDLATTRFDFTPSHSPDDSYTLEQAREDVEYLFYFYALSYGPYFHFGGDEAFGAAKDAVLADLAAMEEITAPAFEASLIEHLSFVGDAHFVINHNYNHPLLLGYLSEQAFLRDTAGFTAVGGGERVRAMAGREDFGEDMVLSVTPGGEIVYRYLVLAGEQPGPVEIVFEGGETRDTAMYGSYEASGVPDPSDETVSLSYMDDIPVIRITGMGFPHANEDQGANYFLELAAQLKDEPVLIVDLRGNPGGNGYLPQMWYEAYTGSLLTPNHYSLHRLDIYTALAPYGMNRSEPDPDSFYYVPADVGAYYANPQNINDSWELHNPEPRQVIENDRLLIVLAGKGTASAADSFTDQTFNVENTLVIGGNTTGMFLSSASIGVRMPNSGMVGQMGFNLSVFDPGHFQEGVGFTPDLWASGDALTAAVALAKQRLAV